VTGTETKLRTSGITAGSVPSRTAWQKVVCCGRVMPSLNSNRQRRFHYLQVLGGAVHPGQESQAQAQRAPGGPQQVGDLPLGVRTLTCHCALLPGAAFHTSAHFRRRHAAQPTSVSGQLAVSVPG